MRKTKIICTIGPASNDPKVMEEMLKNGMNVARLNFSHGTHEEHIKIVEIWRKEVQYMKVINYLKKLGVFLTICI